MHQRSADNCRIEDTRRVHPAIRRDMHIKTKKEGGIIIGKTALDEFGFGTFSTNCAYGIPKNPYDIERACGGSSGGAGCITALADFPHIAIAQSTGGSITAPAAFTGTVGLTPTYGRVSRYGLIDYSNSMDKIGVISRRSTTPRSCSLSCRATTRWTQPAARRRARISPNMSARTIKGMKIGIPKEYMSEVSRIRYKEGVHERRGQAGVYGG